MLSTKLRVLLLLLGVALSIAGAAAARAQSTATVNLNLTKYAKVEHVDAGDFVGVSPGVITVHVGDRIVFANTDTRHHTASFIAGAAAFPQEPHWSAEQLKFHGTIGTAGWSTGDLSPGGRSSPLTVSKAGTYLYGCFFDYSAGMRGVIIVEP